MLKLYGFDGFRYFRIDLFRRGKYVVPGSAAGLRRIMQCWFRSRHDDFKAIGCLFNGVVTHHDEDPALARIQSRNAIFSCASDIALVDGLCRRQVDPYFIGQRDEMGNARTGFNERSEVRGRSEILRFPEAQAAIIKAKSGLFNGFVVQVTTENPSDEGGGKVVELLKQLLADVAAMGS